MNRLIVILLVALGAVAAVRADDLRGVVTFACDEFLVVARERKPSYRGTLVKLVREDGERAFGPDRLQPGDILRIKGELLDASPLVRTFQAALVEKTGRIDELPEPKLPKLSDYRKGWRALTRLRLEGVVKSLNAQGEGRNVRTHLVLKCEGQRLAVCVWDVVDGNMFAPGAKVSVVGVPRTILGADGEAVANELEVSSASDLELLAESPLDLFAPLTAALALALGCVALGFFVAWIRSRAQRIRLEAVSLDRQRIAGELHDTLEQYFAGAKLLMTGAMKVDGVPNRALAMMRQSADMMASAKRETRDAVMNLRSDTAVNGDLRGAVRALARATNEKGIVRVKTHVGDLPEKMDVRAANDILLVIREAITNAVKHGKAKQILLVSDPLGESFSLRILNDGAPFEPAAALGPEAGHFGLAGMRERAERSGFKLDYFRKDPWVGFRLSPNS